MKGDFSRTTFDPAKHFNRVLMQQGRVQLDADWNEQAAILLHYLQALTRDLFGAHGGPEDSGFAVTVDRNVPYSFKIGSGHYYVDGILCENDGDCWYQDGPDVPNRQPDYFPSASERLESFAQNRPGESFLAYLDVWERHITSVEDDSIREKALGGPDTATRARVVWQVKLTPTGGEAPTGGAVGDERARLEMALKEGAAKKSVLEAKLKATKDAKARAELEQAIKDLEIYLENIAAQLKDGSAAIGGAAPSCDGLLATLPGLSAATLKARVKPTEPSTDPCIQAPDARYRGAGNRLYRVEVHEGGVAGGATFKWSRDNGAVIFPIIELNGAVATLLHLGRDARLGLQVGDWVEVVDDDGTLHGDPGPLLQVDAIDPVEMRITLKNPANAPLPVYDKDSTNHPYLRRWDQKGAKAAPLAAGAIPIAEGQAASGWLDLEDGVQIQFQRDGVYRSGDYWLIPARETTGRIEWPPLQGRGRPAEAPLAIAPHGVEHHYAPLAMLTVDAKGGLVRVEDCRCAWVSQRQCPPPAR